MAEVYSVSTLSIVKIGRQGENIARNVQIDCHDWLQENPELILALVAVKPGMSVAYMPNATASENGVLTWTIEAADVVNGGFGSAEIRGLIGQTIVKSKTFKTYVEKTLENGCHQETTVPSWVGDVLDKAAQAMQSAGVAIEKAEEVESAAEDVQGYASTASSAAATAVTAATTATENASQAISSAETAIEKAESASASAASASAAATTAITAASNASEAASSAQTVAEYVRAYAEAAEAHAESASESAATATEAAEEALEIIATAVDPSLSISSRAADAKATGDMGQEILEMLENNTYPGDAITLPRDSTETGAKVIVTSSNGLYTGSHNLWKMLGVQNGTFTVDGVTVTVTDQRIQCSGTATETGFISLNAREFNTSRHHWAETDTGSTLPAGVEGAFALKENADSSTDYLIYLQPVTSGAAVLSQVKNTQKSASFVTISDDVSVLISVTSGHTYAFDILLAVYPFRSSAIPYNTHIADVVTEITSLRPGYATLGVYTWGSGIINAIKLKHYAKQCLIKYEAVSSSPDKSAEQLTIKIPNQTGYIKWALVHTEDSSINSDVWRLGKAFKVDDEGIETLQIASGGAEWETAIHLNDRPDFSGGVAHGDEIMTDDLLVILDGKIVEDVTAITETAFERLEIIENSTYYDPNDSTTEIATNSKRWIFTKDGLRLQQCLIWSVDATITDCYMGMLPVRKVVNRYAFNDRAFPVEITGRVNYAGRSNAVMLYGDNVTVGMIANDFPVYDEKMHMLIHDNGTTAYWKTYLRCKSSGTVADGETWYADVVYTVVA